MQPTTLDITRIKATKYRFPSLLILSYAPIYS